MPRLARRRCAFTRCILSVGPEQLDFNRFEPRPGGRRGAAPPVPLGKLFDKEPPFSVEAEMSLLGSMILDPACIGDIISVVKRSEDFYKPEHGWIYKALVEVFDRHHSGDLVQIQDKLRQYGVYDEVGGDRTLEALASAVPSASNAPHYARIVAEKAKLRKLIDAAGRILFEAYHVGSMGPEGAREVIDAAEMAVFEIAQDEQTSEAQTLAELLQIEMARMDANADKAYTGIPTGFTGLDELLSGLQNGEMLIIAARPSMGKTALVLNMAEQIAMGGSVMASETHPKCPVAVFSLEMSKASVVQRLISGRSGISGHDLRSGKRVDFRRVVQACSELEQAPIYIDDSANLTLMQLRARARRLVAQHGVKVLMIDYLQLLTAPGAGRESRQVEVSAISRGIKALARELNVPVICLSQLNRASEQREGNRPRMSDLRESGSIEQDADVIILLHREEYYHIQNPEWSLENPDKVGIAELIIAKQRNGPTGVVELVWDNKTTRFKNYAGQHYEPPAAPPPPPPAAPMGMRHGHAGGPDDEPAPFGGPPRSQGFVPGRKTGPIDGHRDGGGPDREDDLGDLPV